MPRPRRVLLALAAAAAVAGSAVAATGASAAPPPSTSTLTLDGATSTPTNTGLTVNSQKTVTVTAGTGLVQFAPPCGPFCTTDYRGHVAGGTGPTLACTPDCTLTGAPVGAVLYRVGPNGDWQPLPADGVIPAQKTGGEVYLVVNDNEYGDNTGAYTLTLVRAAA